MRSLGIDMSEKNNSKIKIWLLICLIFILSMVFIGGLTRLTRSGLSITEWNFVTGIIPPMNQEAWAVEFKKYKKIPEFKMINYNMNISQFKKIYLTEYFHRLLGRLAGIVIFVPLILFYIFKKIDKKYFFRLFGIFSLVLIQGLIGWLMVKSGLSKRTSVSEFMLGFHLIFALLIFSLISWEFFKISLNVYNLKSFFKKKQSLLLIKIIIFFALPLQIFFGALVAGIHILGFCNKNAHDLCAHNPFKILHYENYFIMQNLYLHRIFAIVLFSLILIMLWKNFKQKILIKESFFVLFLILIQMLLGTLSLLLSEKLYFNIIFPLIHQLNAFFIMFYILKIFYITKKMLS